MPSFRESASSAAAPEEVWKLLYDPAQFPRWWAGVETVAVDRSGGYTMYPDGYPDFPMPQALQTEHDQRRVTVSCLVSDLRFQWVLEPAGAGTQITVEVEIPAAEAGRLQSQQELISASLGRLVRLAAQ